MRVPPGFALIGALCLVTGCSGSPPVQGFTHQFHRQRYVLEDEDFSELRFYVSWDVHVNVVEVPADSPFKGERSVFLRREVPGRVMESGPNWLRVSFDESSPGTYFVTDPKKTTDLYWLAADVDGALRKVKELPRDAVLEVKTGSFLVVQGRESYLLVNSDDLNRMIKSRRHLQGYPPPED